MNPQRGITQFIFTRLVFGLRSSPAILGAILSHHLITGVSTVEQGFELYQRAKGIVKEAGLNLRKWSSNSNMLLHKVAEMESEPHTIGAHVVRPKPERLSEEESYSKSCTGLIHSVNDVEHSKLLGTER